MSNIAISELQTTADTLENDDLLLVSKKNGDSFTSAKMPGSVLKGSSGSCQAASALSSYGTAKTSDLSGLSTLTAAQVKTQCESAITSKGVSTLTSSQVQSACSTAISSTSISVGDFINTSHLSDGLVVKSGEELIDYTLKYDSIVSFSGFGRGNLSGTSASLYINGTHVADSSVWFASGTSYSYGIGSGYLSVKVKSGNIIKITAPKNSDDVYACQYCIYPIS